MMLRYCGALTGAIIAIGSFLGGESLDDLERNEKAIEPAVRAYNSFKERVGHTLCSEIQRIRYGKSYRLSIPEERQIFRDMSSRSTKGCQEVCGIAAQVGAAVILSLRNPTGC